MLKRGYILIVGLCLILTPQIVSAYTYSYDDVNKIATWDNDSVKFSVDDYGVMKWASLSSGGNLLVDDGIAPPEGYRMGVWYQGLASTIELDKNVPGWTIADKWSDIDPDGDSVVRRHYSAVQRSDLPGSNTLTIQIYTKLLQHKSYIDQTIVINHTLNGGCGGALQNFRFLFYLNPSIDGIAEWRNEFAAGSAWQMRRDTASNWTGPHNPEITTPWPQPLPVGSIGPLGVMTNLHGVLDDAGAGKASDIYAEFLSGDITNNFGPYMGNDPSLGQEWRWGNFPVNSNFALVSRTEVLPEPTTLLLLGTGLGVFGIGNRRKKWLIKR